MQVRGDQDMVNHVAAQTMMMVGLTSVVFGAVGYVLAPHLLRWLGVAPDVYANALGFMRVSFFASSSCSCTPCFRQ